MHFLHPRRIFLPLFVFRLPLFSPTARRSSHLASLLIFQSVSQSERQSPQSCKVTLSQTVVPAETYSKRLWFFWFFPVPAAEMRHGNQPLVENTPCLLFPAQQTHHLEQTAELPWSRWRSSDARSAVLQYVSTRNLTALWRRDSHSPVSEQHPRNVPTRGGGWLEVHVCVAVSSSAWPNLPAF